MLAWFKRSALVLLCFVAVWLLMVVYWRSNHQMPSVSEALFYLLALPAAFLLCIWLLRKAITLLAARAAAASLVTASAVAAEPVVPADGSAVERTWSLAIVATALRSAHGASAEELTATLKSQEARLSLDTELTCLDGFPVKTGRIPGVDGAAVLDAITAWQTASRSPSQAWSDEQLRALAMGSEVLQELLPQLLSHPHLAAYIQAAKAGAAARNAASMPMLQLLAIWPDRWTDEVRQVSSSWLQHLLVQQGWPAEKLELGSVVQKEPLALLDALLVQTQRLTVPCLCLVVACESWIGEDSILEWDQTGKLRKAKVDLGQTPGEGAVALLLADAQQAGLLAADAPYARMHRVASGRRDKSADAGGRVSGELLVQLTQDAMRSTGIAPEQISLLASDGDHRRLAEIFSLEAGVLPDLDFASQCLKVAADCGSAGAVSSLTAFALAHHEASTEQGIALCIGCQDAYDRAVTIVQPHISLSATTAAS